MKIAHVYPLIPLPQHMREPVSYFTTRHLAPGTLVEIPFQRRKVLGVVRSVEDVLAKKQLLRKSSFQLKKIARVIQEQPVFHPAIMTIGERLSLHYLEPAGAIMKTYLPNALLENPAPVAFTPAHDNPFYEDRREPAAGAMSERIEYYASRAREAFARGKSVALFAPTIALTEYLKQELSTLPKQICVIHSGLTPSKLNAAITALRKTSPPFLLIGTPIALGCLRGDEAIIIVEQPDSRHFLKHDHPRIHAVDGIRMFAEDIQAKYIEGKSIPSLEDMAFERKINYVASRQKRLDTPIIMNMNEESDTGTFPVLAERTKEALRREDTRTLVFVSRKGFYSFVVCADCGTLVDCPHCRRPLVLHTETARRYACHRCSQEYGAELACAKCGGWNLRGYGIGTERIAEDIKRALKHTRCWIFDETHIKTKSARSSTIEQFLASKDGVVIGTEMMLEEPALTGGQVVIAHMDNFFSMPDFRINERVVHMLVQLDERGREHPMIIQTRFPHHPVFRNFQERDVRKILEKELEERSREHLPPFSAVIRISAFGANKQAVESEIARITSSLPNLAEAPSIVRKTKKGWEGHVLSFVDTESWTRGTHPLQKALLEMNVPWDVAVNPADIL